MNTSGGWWINKFWGKLSFLLLSPLPFSSRTTLAQSFSLQISYGKNIE
jgi:hypothetical protein